MSGIAGTRLSRRRNGQKADQEQKERNQRNINTTAQIMG